MCIVYVIFITLKWLAGPDFTYSETVLQIVLSKSQNLVMLLMGIIVIIDGIVIPVGPVMIVVVVIVVIITQVVLIGSRR